MAEFKQGKKVLLTFDGAMSDAQVFVNGKKVGDRPYGHSGFCLHCKRQKQGIQKKSNETNQHRYRLMWMDVKYEPGTLKVVAFDKQGNPVAEKVISTAGKPHYLEISPDRTSLSADGKDISFVTISVVDKDGNVCPNATNQLNFKVTGAGYFKAVCNGDATSLEMFHLPTMKAFSGKLVVLVQSLETPCEIILEVESKGLKKVRCH